MSFWKKKETNQLKQATAVRATSDQSKASVAQAQTSPNQMAASAVLLDEATVKSASSTAVASKAAVADKTVTDKISERFGNIRSVLGPQTRIDGKICFDSSIRIDGIFSGEVLSSKLLLVGAGGFVSGEIETETLVVAGRVIGDVHAFEKVIILDGGVLEGNVYSPILVVEEQATFNGVSFNPEFDSLRTETSDDCGCSHIVQPKIPAGTEFAAAMH